LAHESSTEDIFSTISSFNLPVEVNFNQAGILEVGTSQVAVFKGGLQQISLIPDSVAKVTPNENTLYEIIDSSKVRTTEVSVFPTTVISQDSVSKISFPQNSTTEINTEGGIFQLNAAEVNSSHQAFTGITDIDPSKISFSSFIALYQFLNTNTFSYSHNPILQNTTVPACTQFIQGTTPFNPTLNEGTPAQYIATATVATGVVLTYEWSFGDGSSPIQG
jgi:hypothetical protein